jgi:SAM-dependent methyltransferase
MPTPTTAAEIDPAVAQRDALAARIDAATTDMLEMATVYLGERLGYYAALAVTDGLTAAELAARTGTHERYAREWLEQQTVSGLIAVDDPRAAPGDRRFRLPAGHSEVLADPASPDYRGALVRFKFAMTQPLAALLEAFRTGGGVPFADFGADLREGLADTSRLEHELFVRDELPRMAPALHDRFQADPPARIADIGCGAGWLGITLAQTYPLLKVDGYDLDAASVALARRNVAAEGLADRVQIAERDAGDPALAGQYDLVVASACVHDAPRPVDVLRTMRRLAGEIGVVLVLEPKAEAHFMDPANNRDIERAFYIFSVLHCLPAGMCDQPSAGTGTMMRPDILRGYARDAGFRDIEILPIADEWTGAYRLDP